MLDFLVLIVPGLVIAWYKTYPVQSTVVGRGHTPGVTKDLSFHTLDYGPFTNRQLAPRQLTFKTQSKVVAQ